MKACSGRRLICRAINSIFRDGQAAKIGQWKMHYICFIYRWPCGQIDLFCILKSRGGRILFAAVARLRGGLLLASCTTRGHEFFKSTHRIFHAPDNVRSNISILLFHLPLLPTSSNYAPVFTILLFSSISDSFASLDSLNAEK